jgi:glucose uptake protein GlcU
MLGIFRDRKLLYCVTIASFGIAIGALWEIAEWSAGLVLQTEVIESLDDTITDLIMDALGAVLASLISLWALQEWTRPRRQDERAI